MVSDTRVAEGYMQFSCRQGNRRIPYIVVYTKKNVSTNEGPLNYNSEPIVGHDITLSCGNMSSELLSNEGKYEHALIPSGHKIKLRGVEKECNFECNRTGDIDAALGTNYVGNFEGHAEFFVSSSSEKLINVDLINELNQQKDRIAHMFKC